MKVLIGLLVVVALVTVFAWMVRRTNAKGHTVAGNTDTRFRVSEKPKLLSKEQRKALKYQEQRSQGSKVPSSPIQHVPDPAPQKTRAIRTGWSIGKIEFTYQDTEGNVTRRTVTVHSVTHSHIKGECHARRAERTFRIDRIIGDVIDCNTGEILPPQQWKKIPV